MGGAPVGSTLGSAMPTTTFRFGELVQHEMTIVAGYLGRERYYVDGRLVRDHWSYNPRAIREFIVGKHQVRIVVTAGLRSFSSQAYVDGQLYVKELFPEYASLVSRWWSGRGRALQIGLWLLVAAAVLTYLKLRGG